MIASPAPGSYLRPMLVRSLVAVLTMLALLFAPLSMVSGYAAAAMPGQATSHVMVEDGPGHCAGTGSESPKDESGALPGDCLNECALTCSAIPALGDSIVERPRPLALIQPLPLASRVRGLHPESDLPPPRIP